MISVVFLSSKILCKNYLETGALRTYVDPLGPTPPGVVVTPWPQRTYDFLHFCDIRRLTGLAR